MWVASRESLIVVQREALKAMSVLSSSVRPMPRHSISSPIIHRSHTLLYMCLSVHKPVVSYKIWMCIRMCVQHHNITTNTVSFITSFLKLPPWHITHTCACACQRVCKLSGCRSLCVVQRHTPGLISRAYVNVELLQVNKKQTTWGSHLVFCDGGRRAFSAVTQQMFPFHWSHQSCLK